MSGSERPSPTGVPLAKRTPTVADYRRQTAVRDRWHDAVAVLFVTGLAAFVFWLLPLPPAATRSPVAASTLSSACAAAQRAFGVGHEPEPRTCGVRYCE